MKIPGVLERYGPTEELEHARMTLITGKKGAKKFLVLVGGLTAGLLPTGFEDKLLAHLDGSDWALAQAQLRTCYMQFGLGCLDDDADDILMLAQHLRREHGCTEWILAGHSTGCQDAVRYVKRHGVQAEGTPELKGVALLSPVSDRENPMVDLESPPIKTLIATARDLVAEGKSDAIAARLKPFGNVPLSAFRTLALLTPGGDDDLFSSDFSDAQLQELLGHMAALPVLALLGTADETMPESVDKRAHLARICKALGQDSTAALVEGGTHEYTHAQGPVSKALAAYVKACCDLKAHPLDVKGVDVVATGAQ